MKKFSLRGNVHDVGLRMELIGMGIRYNLRVLPTNVEGRNQVDVIVVGNESDIQRFYEYVKSHDIRINKEGTVYEIDSLEDYNVAEPDWTFETIRFIMEQLRKGAFEIFESGAVRTKYGDHISKTRA